MKIETFPVIDILIPEQAIQVPKISSSSRRCRPRVPMVQLMAEQLVEVPTIVSFSSLHGLVEQNVDIPVSLGRGGRVGVKGPQGFSQGQDSTAFVGADRVDIPVPLGREGGGSLQGSRPGQSSTAFDGADHVEIPVPQGRGGVGGPLPSFSGASALPSFSSGELNQGVFSHFSQKKKSAKSGRQVGSELVGGRQLVHAGAYAQGTLAAHPATPVSTWIDDNGDTWKMVHSARVGTYVNQVTHDSQWRPPWEHLPGQGPTASPGRYTSSGHGRGWCCTVDVPEIMQRLFQQFFDRRGCNPCCTVVDVPCVMQRPPADFSRNAWFDSEYMYCVCFLGLLEEFPYFLRDGVLGS